MNGDFWSNLQALRKAYSVSIEPVCQKWNLTRAEIDVLLFLSGDSGMDRAADIVEYRGLTKSHVSVAVKELCRRGLLESRQDCEDRRAIHLKPTAAAVQIVEDGKAAQKAHISKLFEGFTPEEQQQWCKLIRKMGSNVMNMIQE